MIDPKDIIKMIDTNLKMGLFIARFNMNFKTNELTIKFEEEKKDD